MADQHDRVALLGETNRFQVDFGYERACGIDYLQPAFFGFGTDSRGYSMSAEDHPAAFGHFGQFFYKYSSGGTQLIYYVPVMYDFFADIDRRSVEIDGNPDDVDGPNHSGTETARF
jgi:hypothetical protein